VPYIPGPAVVGATLLSIGLVTGVLALMCVLAPIKVGVRHFLPGALVGALALEVVKIVATVYVPRTVASSNQLYGSIGAVLALIGYLLIVSRLVTLISCLHVVRWELRHGTDTLPIAVPAGARTTSRTVGATRRGLAPRSRRPWPRFVLRALGAPTARSTPDEP
jgi:Virulence factor BrkB